MKRTILTGAITLVVGIVCLSVGLTHGGLRTIYWDHGLNVAGATPSSTTTSRFKAINQIQVSTSNPVTIQQGNVSQVTVSYPDKTHVIQISHKLKVQGSNHWKRTFDFLGYRKIRENFGHTTVTVPKRLKLDSLASYIHEYDSDNLNGHVTIDGIKTKKLTFSGESHFSLKNARVTDDLAIDNMGRITLSNNHFKTGVVTNDFGNIVLHSNKFADLSAETDAGNITFNKQQVSKHFAADSELGSINGQVNRRQQAKITLDTELGGKSIFGHTTSNYGSPNIKKPIYYHFTTEIGHVKIG